MIDLTPTGSTPVQIYAVLRERGHSYLTARDARGGIIAAHQSVTRTWWESQRQQYRLLASAIVVREASAGDPEMAAKRLALIADCDLLQITDAVDALAARLLARGLVAATVPNDVLHIAVATGRRRMPSHMESAASCGSDRTSPHRSGASQTGA